MEIYLGGGCFWGLQNRLDQLEGLPPTVAGYMMDAQGWVEVVKVVCEGELETLLNHYFACHDPTSFNRQGMDTGYCYRSVIYVTEASQLETAHRIKAGLKTKRPPLTDILEATEFVEAPETAQRRYEKMGMVLKLPGK